MFGRMFSYVYCLSLILMHHQCNSYNIYHAGDSLFSFMAIKSSSSQEILSICSSAYNSVCNRYLKYEWFLMLFMVCALDSRSSGLGSSLAGDIVLCSWARHLTLSSASPRPSVQMGTFKFNVDGNPAMD